MLFDPYSLDPASVEAPPHSFWATLRRIGPGMILAASIVGSGELIATTTLGAEAGYLALWIVVFSCFVKPAMQAEIGRYSIVTGETGLAGFNRLPGPRFKVSWSVWAWAAMVIMSLFQVGAMFGGVAQVLNTLMPGVTVNAWVLIILGLVGRRRAPRQLVHFLPQPLLRLVHAIVAHRLVLARGWL